MEENKLIAEFMGYKTYKMNGYLNVEYADNNHRTIQDTHYHSSWDWLMPVVEKIREVTSYDRDKFSTEVIIYGNKTTIKSGGYGEKRHSNLFFNKTDRS